MEIAAATIVPVVESASPLVAQRYRDHRDIKKNMETLKEASEKLNRRKADKKKSLENEVESGETEEVEEVNFWLERVEKISNEVEEIGKKVARVKFFSRAGLGRKVVEMIPKVEKLYEEGTFGEGKMVRELQQRGSKKPTTKILEGETTTENTRDEILGCLIDEKIARIGVYGMGGLGKTTVLEHVHNIILKGDEEIGTQFDKVIWITVSKGSSVRSIQEKIACELSLDISKYDDEEKRAKELFKEFNRAKNKRFVLIIDDLWESYHLERVGVPDPTSENGCKLVLTTRSHDVCSMMKCDQIIKMGFLSEEEAVNLFMFNVGQSVAMDPELGEITRQVARECACLPLAIVTVARSLRDKTDPIEWEVALTELKDATASTSIEITEILRFSYDRLQDEKYKECLLYCALYSEDYLIEKDLLIDELIVQGIVDEAKPRKHKMNKCGVMLNALASSCLLIDTVDSFGKKCVKLHDSVRDMAIQIMRDSPRFFVEAGEEFESLNTGQKWDERVEKVSLMKNKIKVFPFVEPPNCPSLSTLILSMSGFEHMADDFFIRLVGLCVLDLSHTKIRILPSSISSLTKLAVLLLNNCRELIWIPDLSKLGNLTRLNLNGTSLFKVPQGVENLIKLTHLHLRFKPMFGSLPKGLLHKLSDLRYLSIFFPSATDLSYAEDLGTLKKLETFEAEFENFSFFSTCMRAILNGDARLKNFNFKVGTVHKLYKIFEEYPKNSVMMDCSFNSIEDNLHLPILLPTNVENLYISSFWKETDLSRTVSIEDTTNLRRLTVYDSFGNSEYLFYYSPTMISLLQKIEVLNLKGIRNLRGLVGTLEGDDTVIPPLPLEVFFSLKKLSIKKCDKMKTLFVMAKDASLPNLEEIEIDSCRNLEEIIVNGNHEKCEDAITSLPSLKKLKLSSLFELKSVPLIADSLSSVTIKDCKTLKKVAFLERKPYPTSLQFVDIDYEPWNSLGKEHMMNLPSH